MATTRIKDLSKTATTVNSDANLVLDGNTGGTQKISRDNFRQDTADAFVAAPGTYNLAPLNSGTGKIDAVYLSSSSDTPKGAWDASSNTPTLADGSGTAGDYYDVTVAGSSDLGSGSIAFTVGDVVKYNGTVWFKIDSVANILDGVSTIDGAKTAIEIPDVGTAPNEVPLNGMLGDMAFQSSAGVAMGDVEAESLTVEAASASADPILTTQAISGGSTITGLQVTAAGAVTMSQNLDLTGDEKAIKFHSWESGNQIDRALIKADGDPSGAGFGGSLVIHTSDDGTFAERMRVDPQGRVGIGTATPSSFHSSADDLVIGQTASATHSGITVANASGGTGSVFFAKGTSGDALYRGQIQYAHGSDTMYFATAGASAWSINSSGNFVAATGKGIDFGSAATSAGQGTGTTGTPANSVLSDYEYGSWTPTIAPSGGSFTSITMDVQSATYVKVGRMVHCQAYIRTDGLDTTGASGSVRVTGLPFVNSGSSNYAAVSVGLSRNWVTNPAGGYVNNGVASLTLTKRTTSSTELIEMEPADMTTGSGTDKNAVLMSFQYIAST